MAQDEAQKVLSISCLEEGRENVVYGNQERVTCACSQAKQINESCQINEHKAMI